MTEAADCAAGRSSTTALDNDLNTSLAVTALYDVLKAKTSDSHQAGYAEPRFDTVLGAGAADRSREGARRQAPRP